MTKESLILVFRPVFFSAHLEFLVVHFCLLLAYLATPNTPADTCLWSLLIPCSNVAVSSLIPVSVDTVAVGLVSSVVVYPLYLVILFLFRMARGKVRSGVGCRLLRWVGGHQVCFWEAEFCLSWDLTPPAWLCTARLHCTRARPFPGLCLPP